LYEGGHRVPCFLRWPKGGLVGPRDVDALGAHVDLLPTLIDLCRLNRPEGARFDGISLAPLLTGRAQRLPEREIFVQFRQSADPPEKWKAAVLAGRWRLIGGKELYDIDADPGQRSDVAERHPDVVERLRKAYEAWWSEVSPAFDSYCEIVLGADEENPAKLNGFDWHTKTPWNQGAIRSGVAANGFWAVEIEQAGSYEFTLRRWPAEVDAPITAAIPGGKAIAATTARLKTGQHDLTKPIPRDAASVAFQVELKAGKTTLQTWLIDDASGQSRGAYHVEVKRR
jgi:hypothetical protein